MGKFFESDMVREEHSKSINFNKKSIRLQQFSSMSRKDKLEHIDKLTELLEKQKIMYARLSLSDDPELKNFKYIEVIHSIDGIPTKYGYELIF